MRKKTNKIELISQQQASSMRDKEVTSQTELFKPFADEVVDYISDISNEVSSELKKFQNPKDALGIFLKSYHASDPKIIDELFQIPLADEDSNDCIWAISDVLRIKCCSSDSSLIVVDLLSIKDDVLKAIETNFNPDTYNANTKYPELYSEETKKKIKQEAGERLEKNANRVWDEFINGSITQELHSENNPHLICQDTTFGLEMEGFIPTKAPLNDQLEYIKEKFEEKGLNATTSTAYSDTTGETWVITTDGSVTTPFLLEDGGYAGLEIISPILKGDEGTNEIETVSQILSDIGFQSNFTAGLHTHIGMDGRTFEETQNFAIACIENENTLDEMIEESRRNNNNFCASHRNCDVQKAKDADNIKDLVDCISHDRYHKFNFTNLVYSYKPNTVEFRAKEGSGFNQAAQYVTNIVNFSVNSMKDRNYKLSAANIEKPEQLLAIISSSSQLTPELASNHR